MFGSHSTPEQHDQLLQDVFDESPMGVLRVTYLGNRLGTVLDANPAAAAHLGRPLQEVVGNSLVRMLPGVEECRPEANATVVLPAPRSADQRWVSVTTRRLSRPGPDGTPLVLAVVHDVTEQWTARARLDRMARHDPLTGLMNRGELLRRLAAIDPSSQGPLVGVIFLDLDGFKLVNDTRGHQVGDELLVAVARRIRGAVRPDDVLARIGGDEFVVVCPGIKLPQDIRAVAERVRSTLDDPVSVAGRAHRISMSVGVAVAEAGTAEAGDLLRQADLAMYRAKDAGRNAVRFHDAAMDEELATTSSIQRALSEALADDVRDPGAGAARLELHYQPIVEIATGLAVYVEALARLRLGDGSLVYPSDFLSVAARAGLNVELSERVLSRALRHRRGWVAGGVDVPVGLNLARGQVESASFADEALRIIARGGDRPGDVVFEIGEFGLLEATGPAQLTLRRLRASGIGLAIDHFGTGYSSLGALRFLGPHRVKIDRSFVASIPYAADDRAIVAAAVSAAHALGQRVVAEGVETSDQLTVLTELGCDEAQGFLVSHVLPADQLDLAGTQWSPWSLERREAGPAIR